ncbi:4-hydroxythreonine-4-phosphate dehydrogenase PdxA [Hymenobacter busanensis]|uniref:4-hydroxythreonine-4-phosphate dehydrogenase PdxA n=1 Tax=Hymenobacter busanensis TaxID=2607656 RepID=A0A7L4ZV23_9BACT|nr:4-hydroxythreonine-4-phosphate dehydrogenase PdxA [Hymenobacter busanensis]KAA9339579.1 4-hydroxythreonine-4-phosphate dehydrogenase PdxA [Hymenobacter busanensis]QHJ06666.1 4-hydroxythreonine-4-phosphate dehydrogenase PdxA [Hymenobacter busanensis]
MLPRIAITTGDLAGIGPEIIYRTLQDARMLRFCTPVVYGTAATLFDDFPQDKQHTPMAFRQVREAADIVEGKINAVTCWDEEDFTLTPGQPSEASGRAARLSLLAAVRDMKAGLLDGLVTAPISKDNTQGEGFNFPGHTEFLAHHFSPHNDSLMLLVADELRVATATGHIALKDVPARLTPEVLSGKLRMLLHSLRHDFGIAKPRVAVLGLNPHAGENGLLGREEQDLVQPVIQQFLNEGHLVYGPYPADGFFGTRQYQQFDATLALYHDQGLIPFKTLAFERGVNYTAGLPVVRTSPDHGTAYGLAGKFAADPTSFREALYLACDLIKNRTAAAAK